MYPAIPSITQAVSSNILAHSAELGGTITATNGGVVSQRGVVWSTTTNFTVSSGIEVGEDGEYGAGAFSVSVTGLYGGTIHYFRAYAANVTGTNYTEQAWFLTLPDAPAPETATQITTTSMVANWSAALSATNYLLDVSVTNNFTNYVAGYESLAVGNADERVGDRPDRRSRILLPGARAERDGREYEFGDAIRLDAAAGAGVASSDRGDDQQLYGPVEHHVERDQLPAGRVAHE